MPRRSAFAGVAEQSGVMADGGAADGRGEAEPDLSAEPSGKRREIGRRMTAGGHGSGRSAVRKAGATLTTASGLSAAEIGATFSEPGETNLWTALREFG